MFFISAKKSFVKYFAQMQKNIWSDPFWGFVQFASNPRICNLKKDICINLLKVAYMLFEILQLTAPWVDWCQKKIWHLRKAFVCNKKITHFLYFAQWHGAI